MANGNNAAERFAPQLPAAVQAELTNAGPVALIDTLHRFAKASLGDIEPILPADRDGDRIDGADDLLRALDHGVRKPTMTDQDDSDHGAGTLARNPALLLGGGWSQLP